MRTVLHVRVCAKGRRAEMADSMCVVFWFGQWVCDERVFCARKKTRECVSDAGMKGHRKESARVYACASTHLCALVVVSVTSFRTKLQTFDTAHSLIADGHQDAILRHSLRKQFDGCFVCLRYIHYKVPRLGRPFMKRRVGSVKSGVSRARIRMAIPATAPVRIVSV